MIAPVISYPFGNIEQQTIPFVATMTITVSNQKTQATIAQMTAASTINLVPSTELRPGADITIRLESDGTNRTVAMGTGILGLPITVNANKIKYAVFVYDGSQFVNTASNQIN